MLAVGGAGTRALDRHTPPAERDLAAIVAMTHRAAVRIVPALRADNLVDLGLHQLVQHTEPNADAQRQQPFLRGAGELAERLLHRGGQLLNALLAGRDRPSRYGPHGGWSSCPRTSDSHSPRSQQDRTRREDRRLQVLRATGQPQDEPAGVQQRASRTMEQPRRGTPRQRRKCGAAFPLSAHDPHLARAGPRHGFGRTLCGRAHQGSTDSTPGHLLCDGTRIGVPIPEDRSLLRRRSRSGI